MTKSSEKSLETVKAELKTAQDKHKKDMDAADAKFKTDLGKKD